MLLELQKEYLKNDDLTIYTIKLDDGQSLTITENEYNELKEKINELN